MQIISDILATFHDGGIEGINRDHSELELKIGCIYLAELEKEGNEYFFLTLEDVSLFEFHLWNGNIIKDFEAITQLNLEIGYSKLEDGIIKTYCNIWTKEEGDSGGELRIMAKYVSLKNQDQKTLKPEVLYALSEKYWNRK